MEDSTKQQREQDAQIVLHLQDQEQRQAARPVQLGPKRQVAPPTEEELACARKAFGGIILDDDEPTVAVTARREVLQAREAYQPPPCEIRVFKPQTHTLELIAPTGEEEAQLAKQAFKPQAHIIEIVAPGSDEDEVVQQSELLACKASTEIAAEAEISHERAVEEQKRQERIADHLAQHAKDQKEAARIRNEEKKLQAAKEKVVVDSEEARLNEKAMEALLDQKRALLDRVKKRKEVDHK